MSVQTSTDIPILTILTSYIKLFSLLLKMVSSIELQSRRAASPSSAPNGPFVNPPPVQVGEQEDILQRHLKPADRGHAAWKLLGAAFVFEALLWGELIMKWQCEDAKFHTSRISALFRCLSELLFSASTVREQSLYSHRGYCSFWNILPWSSTCYSIY